MTEIETILVTIISALGIVTFFMIRSWAMSWELRLNAHDERLGEHDVDLATISTNMEHIKVSVDETRDDVKELLKAAIPEGGQTHG